MSESNCGNVVSHSNRGKNGAGYTQATLNPGAEQVLYYVWDILGNPDKTTMKINFYHPGEKFDATGNAGKIMAWDLSILPHGKHLDTMPFGHELDLPPVADCNPKPDKKSVFIQLACCEQNANDIAQAIEWLEAGHQVILDACTTPGGTYFKVFIKTW